MQDLSPPSLTLAGLNDDHAALLIPDFDDNADALRYIESQCEELFEHELNGWRTDEKDCGTPERLLWRKEPAALEFRYPFFYGVAHQVGLLVDVQLKRDIVPVDVHGVPADL